MALLYAAPMTDLADLERRVIALEAANNENAKTLNWAVGTLGRLAADVSAVKDDVKELKSEVREIKADLSGLRKEFRDFQTSQPAMIADVMREVLRERSGE